MSSARAFGTYPITEYILGGLLAGVTMVLMGLAFLAGIRDLARYAAMRRK
jgi:hypothetical protein